jgi:Acetamidase/Formamidase family
MIPAAGLVLPGPGDAAMATTHHELAAAPATCHWGSFDTGLAPVLTVGPGDRVTVHTVNGPPDALPGEGIKVLPEQVLIHEQLRPAPGPHILTGPIRIAGARPGDVLEVRILEIALRQDWGWTRVRPLWGTLPEDFHDTRLMHTALDATRMVGRLFGAALVPMPNCRPGALRPMPRSACRRPHGSGRPVAARRGPALADHPPVRLVRPARPGIGDLSTARSTRTR